MALGERKVGDVVRASGRFPSLCLAHVTVSAGTGLPTSWALVLSERPFRPNAPFVDDSLVEPLAPRPPCLSGSIKEHWLLVHRLGSLQYGATS